MDRIKNKHYYEKEVCNMSIIQLSIILLKHHFYWTLSHRWLKKMNRSIKLQRKFLDESNRDGFNEEVAKWQKYCNRCDYYQNKCLKIEEYYEHLKTHQLEEEL